MKIQDLQSVLNQQTKVEPVEPYSPVISSVFSLLTLMQSSTTLPRAGYTFVFSFIILQFCFSYSWPLRTDQLTDFEVIGSYVFLFTAVNEDNTFTVLLPIISFLTLLLVFYLIASSLMFFKFKTLSKISLYSMNVIMHFIIPVLTPPLSFVTGVSIRYYQSRKENLYLGMCILNVIVIIFSFLIIFITYTIDANTIYPKNSPNYCFRGSIQTIFLIGTPIILFGSAFCENGYDSFYYLFLVLGIIENLLVLIFIFPLPFAQVFENALMSSLSISFLIGNMLSLRQINLSPHFRFAIILIIMIVFAFILYFPFKAKVHSILHAETFDTPEQGLTKLRFALMQYHPIFLEGDLVNKVCDIVEKPRDRLDFCRYVCCFPDFQSAFTLQLANVAKNTDLDFYSSYLLYQLNLHETGRQRLVKLKEIGELIDESAALAQLCYKFWIDKSSEFSTVEAIANHFTYINNHWLNVIATYPSNALLPPEYVRFLIECHCSFSEATRWDIKGEKLQEGKNFEYDRAVICLLRAFPLYAKTVIPKLSITSFDDMDYKKREDSLKHLINEPELKFELQNSLGNIKPRVTNFIILFTIIKLVGIIVFWVVFIIRGFDQFDLRIRNLKVMRICNSMHMNTIMTVLPQIYVFENYEWVNISELNRLTMSDGIEHAKSLLPLDTSFVNISKLHSIARIDNEREAMIDVINNIINGFDLQLLINELFDRTMPIAFFDDFGNKSIQGKGSFHQILVAVSTQNLLNANLRKSDYYTMAYQITKIIEKFEAVIHCMITCDENYYMKPLDYIIYSTYGFLAIFFVILTTAIIGCYIIFKRDLNRYIKLCYKFDPKVNEKASKPLLFTEITATNNISLKPNKYNSVLHMVLDAVISLILAAVIIVILLQLQGTHLQLSQAHKLTFYASMRAMKSLEIVYELTEVVIKLGQIDIQTVIKSINDLEQFHLKFIDSSPKDFVDIDPCPGVDIGINRTYHESYSCLPLDSAVQVYIQLARKLLPYIHEPDFFKRPDMIHLMHLEFDHLYFRLTDVLGQLNTEVLEEKENFNNLMLEIGFPSMFVTFTFALFTFILTNKLNTIFKTFTSLLMRLSPTDIASNEDLINLLIYKGQKNEESQLSPLGSLIYDSTYPIALLGPSNIVESINRSFTNLFGYESVQILGQNLYSTLNISDESQVECKKDNNIIITCKVEKFVISEDNIMVMFTDLTSQMKLRSQYEDMKQKNEHIIKFINPIIFKRIQNGDFKKVTVCAINLTKSPAFETFCRINRQMLQIQKRYSTILHVIRKFGKCYFIFADPIDCMNFGFQINSSLIDLVAFSYGIGMAYGGPLTVFQTSGQEEKTVLTSSVFTESRVLSEMFVSGQIITTEELYHAVVSMDINSEKIVIEGKNYYKIQPLY